MLQIWIIIDCFSDRGLDPAPMPVAPEGVLHERDLASRNAGALKREDICHRFA